MIFLRVSEPRGDGDADAESSLSQRLGLKRVGEERKGEEDVRTSSNCLQFRPLGRGGGRYW